MKNDKKCVCYFCNREFSSQPPLAAHIKRCPNNIFKNLSNDIKEYTFVCEKCGKTFTKMMSEYSYELLKFRGRLSKYCLRSCANSRLVTEEVKEKIRNGVKSFNKDYPYFNILIAKRIINTLEEYKKLSDKDIENYLNSFNKNKICKYCVKSFTYIKGESISSIYCSSECKHKYLSEHTGGYRKGAGHGKSGWYNGIYCDSSWELAFVIYHIDNGLNIKRCKERRKYTFNGKEHIYIPDFVTDNGIIEIKGYKTAQWLEKENQNPDIKVLYKDDIKFYIDYAVKHYGKNYIKLYDNLSRQKSIYDKEKSWFYKINHETKTFINAFVTNKNDFQYYINNNWNEGRLPINAFNDYTDARDKISSKLRYFISAEEKERYLSSLI